jgi:putative Mg2+ transporter-C (MgtC) family protein
MISVISNGEIFIRLMAITVIASLIGLEREYHHKPAGLRTNVMVGLGSTLITIASIKAVELFPQLTTVDPTRIAAQIITGIGFIGAGAILRPVSGTNQNVVGLTTAATLWVVCGLGIAVGMGFYFEAVLTTILVFFTFLALGRMVNRIREFTRLNPPKSVLEDEDVLRGNGPEGTHEH